MNRKETEATMMMRTNADRREDIMTRQGLGALSGFWEFRIDRFDYDIGLDRPYSNVVGQRRFAGREDSRKPPENVAKSRAAQAARSGDQMMGPPAERV